MRRSYSRTADTQLLVMSTSSAQLEVHASLKQMVVLMSQRMLTKMTTCQKLDMTEQTGVYRLWEETLMLHA